MNIQCVKAVFFSPHANTKFVIQKITERLAENLRIPSEFFDFTLPGARETVQNFPKDCLVLLGVPVYAGRIPNKLLPFIQTHLTGNGTPAAAVATFGNRSYDDALLELRCELEQNGLHAIAAAAFAAQHAFSAKLASGRPDDADLAEIMRFADAVSEKITQADKIPPEIFVHSTHPVPKYYTPLGTDGQPAVFLKAKPKTTAGCTDCKICASVCPMGSIDFDHPDTVTGICIKCQACVKACPVHAKYFDDPAFLSHVKMLEQTYTKRAADEIFL